MARPRVGRACYLCGMYSSALTSPHCNKEDAKCSMNWLEDVLAPPQVRVPLSQTNERLCQQTNIQMFDWAHMGMISTTLA